MNLSSYCPSLERVQGEEIINFLKLMTFEVQWKYPTGRRQESGERKWKVKNIAVPFTRLFIPLRSISE